MAQLWRVSKTGQSWPYGDPDRYTFFLGVKKRNYLFISGCSASQYDPSLKKVVCKGGVVDQTRVAYDKIKRILEAAGGSFDDVVNTLDYVTPEDLANYRYTSRVRREFFTNTYPTATGVVVEKLPRPDQLIEVAIVAILGGERK